jgi:hypothetical protein
MSQLSLHRGPTPCLTVGPWSGIRPRPTQTPLSDIMQGLHDICSIDVYSVRVFKLRCCDLKLKLFVIKSLHWELMLLLFTYVIYLPVM